jgi:hypothetical protein
MDSFKGDEQGRGPKRTRRPGGLGGRKRRPDVESLESRQLMAIGAVNPPLTAPLNANIADVKAGPLANAGPLLVGVYQEYQQYQQAGGVGGFRSAMDPYVQFRGDKVGVTLSAYGDFTRYVTSARNLGLDVVASDNYYKIVEGYLPIAQLPTVARMVGTVGVAPMIKPVTFQQGVADNQGDIALRAVNARQQFNVNGSGVTVGVLSDSVNLYDNAAVAGVGLAESVATGDLPNNVNVLQDFLGGAASDEGRAMLEQIYDIAPGAGLAFHSAFNGELSFASGIRALANVAGAQVIVDDVGYATSPMFQDGIIAQAVTDVVSNRGVTYFSSAGNSADHGYESQFRGANATVGSLGAGRYMDFDPGAGVATTMPVTVTGGGRFTMQFDQPWYTANGVLSDVDIFFLDANGAIVAQGISNNTQTQQPFEFFVANAGTYQVAIRVVSGPDPGRVRFQEFGGAGLQVSKQFGNAGGTTYPTTFGQGTANEAIGVGAVNYFDAPAFSTANPTLNADYSSDGPVNIVFNPDGSRKAAIETRMKPDMSGTDANNTSFFIPGFDIEGDGLPNFTGTSSSAPNLAAVAALMKQLSPAARAPEIRSAMIASTIPLNGAIKGQWDIRGGFGLVQADAALSAIDTLRVVTATPGAQQTLASSPNAVVVTFNRAINPQTLQASDLVFTATPPGVQVVVGTPVLLNATTVSFPTTFTTTATALANGAYSYQINDGAIQSIDGKPLVRFQSGFSISDVIAPRVTNTIQVGRVIVVQFSESMRGSTIAKDTILLNRLLPGGGAESVNWRPELRVIYDAANNRAIIDLNQVPQQFLPSGNYLIYVSETVTDVVGNRLDGEFGGTPPAGNGSVFPSGNGLAGGEFYQFLPFVTLTAPQILGTGIDQSSGPVTVTPRVTGTYWNRQAVEVAFNRTMDPATINNTTVILYRSNGNGTNFGNAIPLTPDPRVTVRYDAATNRAVIDLSRLPDADVPLSDGYLVVVTTGARDRLGVALDGQMTNPTLQTRNTVFPSGDADPLSTTSSMFFQVIPSLRTSGPDPFIRFDSGIAGDQNTDVTRPRFVGSVLNSFPGAIGGLQVAVQFNGLRNGTFDLRQGQDGRGYIGTPDLVTLTDGLGNFSFQAPRDLPDGLNRVRIVVVGQPDQPPFAGLSSVLELSFRVDTTTPAITGSNLDLPGNAIPRIQSFTGVSLNVIDPVLPSSALDPLIVPTQLSLPALDPTSAENISNYSLITLGSDNALGGTGSAADTDFSSFVTGARFVSTSNRRNPTDPYTARIDLSIASGLPSGRYVLIARRPQPGFGGITDAAGNPIDGDANTAGAQDYVLTIDLQPEPVYVTGLNAITRTSDTVPIDLNNPATFIASGPRSFFEIPSPGTTPRAVAPPSQFVVDFSTPLSPLGFYANSVQLLRSANGPTAAPDGDFGLDSAFTTGIGYTRVGGTTVALVNSVPGAVYGEPGYLNRLVLTIQPGTSLPSDTYRLFLPNVGTNRIIDLFGNQLDGEFLGSERSDGTYENLMPNGSYRAGLSGDAVAGGAFTTGFSIVPNGNVIYARPDYLDDPNLAGDDPDGSLARPFPTLAPEAIANGLNNGDLNSATNFGTGFDPRLDRNQNGRFDRSALFAAQQRVQATGGQPAVVVALPGIQQRDPITGTTTQATFVLAAPAGGTDPVANNASISIPASTVLSFAAGSALKLQNASIFVQNQGSGFQVRGGMNPEDQVLFTSYADDTVGGDSNRDGAPGSGGTVPNGGDWGGIIFRNYDQTGRSNLLPFAVDGRLKAADGNDARSGADEAMTAINFARLRYAGGPVPRTIGQSDGPITLFNSRLTLTNSVIADSKIAQIPGNPNPPAASGTVGAITADFDSFREDELARGPLFRRVDVINNSINGVFIRATPAGVARQTDAMRWLDLPTDKGGTRNFVVDDPLPHVLTTRLVIGEEELVTTGGFIQQVANRLYVQPGMMFKMPAGAAIDVLNASRLDTQRGARTASINIGDRTYINQFDLNSNLAPTDSGFRAPNVGDARVLFTSFYDDLATTFFRDPNTGAITTIIAPIDTDNGGPAVNQPGPGNVPAFARWGSLAVDSNALSVIDEATFQYGGGSVNFPGTTRAQRDVLTFQGTTALGNFYDGINKSYSGIAGTFAFITNNDFTDNLQAPIGIEPDGLLAGDPLRPLRSGNPYFRGNVFQRNELNGLEVLPGLQNVGGFTPNLHVDSVWDDTDLLYLLRGTIRLDGSAFTTEFPVPDPTQFTQQLRPYVLLTIQASLPDQLLADGKRVARPGETNIIKLLNAVPVAGDDTNGSSNDFQGGAGFLVGVDDGIDPTAPDPFIDPGAFSQIRILGIGANETTGQQRVPVLITSMRDTTAFRTVRGVTMGDAASQTLSGNTAAPAPGDGGLIYFGSLSLTDGNLLDSRDGNLIENADIKFITRIEQQGGGIVYSGTGSPLFAKLGTTPGTQFNSARAMTISNSNLSNFSQVGVLAHPGPGNALIPGGGRQSTPGFRGFPTLTYLVNNTISNMPVGVRIRSEQVNDDQFQQPAEAVILHNTFHNVPLGVDAIGMPFNGAPNENSHVHFLVMNNIFDGSTTAAVQITGQTWGSQGQFNLFSNSNPVIRNGGTGNEFPNSNARIGNALFRSPTTGDFTLLPGSDAIDAGLSELGQVWLGRSLLPIIDQASGLRNSTGRDNAFGGRRGSQGQPGDIVTLPGFDGRTFLDQWVPSIPGTPGAQAGPASNPATFWYTAISGQRDQLGFIRVDDPTTARIGAGRNPFYDIGALERRIIVPPKVTGVSAVFIDPSAPGGVRTRDFYAVGGVTGSNAAPISLQFKLDSRLDPLTVNSRTVILQASGGDGLFGNGNNAADRTIDLSGKLSYNANTQTITVSLSGVTPALANDLYRITLFGNGSDVLRDPQGIAIDGENTQGGLATGAQLALPSGDNIPGGNFFLSFTIDTNPPSVEPFTFALDPSSDTGRTGDNITSLGRPAFSGRVTDIFPPANAAVGQTVILDYAGIDGVFGRLLPSGLADPTDPFGKDDLLYAGTALTAANGLFTVTVGTDGASTGRVVPGQSLPDTRVDVGPDGYLGPNPGTGNNDDNIASYGLARVRVIDQSGNTSSPSAMAAMTRFVVDTRGPRFTAVSPAPNALVTPSTGGLVTVVITTNENFDPASLNSSSVVGFRSGGDGVFGNGNDIPLGVVGSITAAPVAGSATGAMQIVATFSGATANDQYLITVRGTGNGPARDWAGNALDGEFTGLFPTGDGTPGGDFNLSFIVISPVLPARNLFVDDDAFGIGGTGTRANPYRTITQALAAAGVGDTIAVLPGLYEESIALRSFTKVLSAGLSSTDTLVQPGQALQTIIRPPAAIGTQTVAVTAANLLSLPSFYTELAGFTIALPLQFDAAAGPIDTSSIGVSIVDSNVMIARNYIINAGFGIVASNTGINSPVPRIESNGLIGNAVGLLLNGNDALSLRDDLRVRVANNTFAFNTHGVLVQAGPVFQNQVYADIDNNIFAQNFVRIGTSSRGGSAMVNTTNALLNIRANLFDNNGSNPGSVWDDVIGVRNFDPGKSGNLPGNAGFANPRDPRPQPTGQGPAVFFLDANFDLTQSSDAVDNAIQVIAPGLDFRSRGRVDVANKGRVGFGPADMGAFEFRGTGGIPGLGSNGAALPASAVPAGGTRTSAASAPSSTSPAPAPTSIASRQAGSVDLGWVDSTSVASATSTPTTAATRVEAAQANAQARRASLLARLLGRGRG